MLGALAAIEAGGRNPVRRNPEVPRTDLLLGSRYSLSARPAPRKSIRLLGALEHRPQRLSRKAALLGGGAPCSHAATAAIDATAGPLRSPTPAKRLPAPSIAHMHLPGPGRTLTTGWRMRAARCRCSWLTRTVSGGGRDDGRRGARQRLNAQRKAYRPHAATPRRHGNSPRRHARIRRARKLDPFFNFFLGRRASWTTSGGSARLV